MPLDLKNLTMRINTNHKFPSKTDILPIAYKNPYPIPENEMFMSFIRFNFDETKRLKQPIVSHEGKNIEKGKLIEFKYPENDKEVFFRYSFSAKIIPTFFFRAKI